MCETGKTSRLGRAYGFRLSMRDLAVIVFFVLLTWPLLHWWGEMGWLPLVVLGHFFLFCNVFRIPRINELIWAGLFILNVYCWVFRWQWSWLNVLMVQSPVTAAVIAADMFTKNYHGLCYRWINPRHYHDRGGKLGQDTQTGI